MINKIRCLFSSKAEVFYLSYTTATTLLAAAPLIAQESRNAPEIAAEVRPAVVSVRAMVGGAAVAGGTGFLVRDDGVIVTSLHVVDDASSLEIELESGEVYDNVYVLDVDERRDLVLLQIPTTNLPTVTVGDDRTMNIGDPVYVMGNPMGLAHTFSDGLLSARRSDGGVAYLQISAPISQGSSGGPVLNAKGEAVGVATRTVTEGQNLNIAVPARHARGMLALAGDPEPFTSMSRQLGDPTGQSTAGLTRGVAELADSLDLDSEMRRDLASLETWEQVVAIQIIAIIRVGQEDGWVPLDERKLGYLKAGDVDVAAVRLGPGLYKAIAVCDEDCDDIDLAVMDGDGQELGRDVLTDDFPIVDFRVRRAGEYFLGASMVECSTRICYFGIQLLSR